MKIKLSKKAIIFIILILSLVIIGRILKVQGYIPKDFFYQTLVKLHIIKPCYNAYKNMLEIYNQEGFDYEKENEKAIKDSLIKLEDIQVSENSLQKVNTITHRIYLVNEASPPTLNDFYIELMKTNFNKLNNLSVAWEHNIWTNYPDIFPEEIKNIKSVKIRKIQELKESNLYEALLGIIEKGQEKKPYLAEAADLARIIIVEKFGGIYMDMDYEIYNPPEMLKLMKKFDFFAGREVPSQHSQYGNAFFAAKAKHPIMVEAVKRAYRNRLAKNEQVPIYIKYPCNGYDELYFNGPPLITMSYFVKNNIDGNNDVILPPWMIFNLNYARYKNGIYYSQEEKIKLDNFLIIKLKKFFRIGTLGDPVCDYSLITKEDFQQNNQKINQLMLEFTNNITMDDLDKYFIRNNAAREFLNYEDNIFYNLKDKKKYPIIGADMFCGGWTEGGKVFKRRYYWNFLK